MLSSQAIRSVPYLDEAGRALLARHADWWKRKGMLYSESPDSPLDKLWLPLSNGTEATEDLDLEPEMLDLDRLAGEACAPGPLEFYGDHVHSRAPYGRVPWVEAILGCKIRATILGGAMRSRSFIRDWDEWQRRSPRRDLDWLSALEKLTEMLAQRSGGRYAVVHTLMRGPSDLAEAILGPEFTCFSMYDHPAELRSFLEEVTQAFIDILKAQRERTPMVQGGYVNPFGIWAPGTVVRTQCDASAFLSPKQYADWFLPYDVRICEAVDYSCIHLHSGSLHTVDALLAVERPHAIQVSIDPEPSGPPPLELVPVLRKILEKKPLILTGPIKRHELDELLRQVPRDGLALWASIEQE